MKAILIGICCFVGAWILLNLISPLHTVLFTLFGFQFTLAVLLAMLIAFLAARSVK